VVDLGQEIFAREQPPPEALAPFHVVADHQGGRSQGRVKLISGIKVRDGTLATSRDIRCHGEYWGRAD
jgi:hypothetical protein